MDKANPKDHGHWRQRCQRCCSKEKTCMEFCGKIDSDPSYLIIGDCDDCFGILLIRSPAHTPTVKGAVSKYELGNPTLNLLFITELANLVVSKKELIVF